MRRALLMVLLVGVGLAYGQPKVQGGVQAKEKQLKEALFSLRTAIDQYAFDHNKAPRTTADLVDSHYLREIPIDPMTGSRTTWQVVMEDSSNTLDKSAPGVFDVRSGSTKTGLDGKRYSEW